MEQPRFANLRIFFSFRRVLTLLQYFLTPLSVALGQNVQNHSLSCPLCNCSVE